MIGLGVDDWLGGDKVVKVGTVVVIDDEPDPRTMLGIIRL